MSKSEKLKEILLKLIGPNTSDCHPVEIFANEDSAWAGAVMAEYWGVEVEIKPYEFLKHDTLMVKWSHGGYVTYDVESLNNAQELEI